MLYFPQLTQRLTCPMSLSLLMPRKHSAQLFPGEGVLEHWYREDVRGSPAQAGFVGLYTLQTHRALVPEGAHAWFNVPLF